jgi:hypothetical protein
MTGVLLPAETRIFSVRHRVQISSGPHPASCPVDTGVISLRVKRPGREVDHLPPFIGEAVNALDLYEGRLQSSWTHLIAPSRNFEEVRWRSLFRSTSLSKRCTSYNAPPTFRKRAADRWSLLNFLPRSSLFMDGKTQKSQGARSGLYGGCSNGVLPIHFFQAEHRIQFRSRPMRFLGFSNHEKGVPRQEISKWSTVCSTFSRSGWSFVSSASLGKGGTSKKRPSPHLHQVPTQSNKDICTA